MEGGVSLLEVLGRARELGFLGPGPLEDHRDHALGYLQVMGRGWVGRAADLGSGGGVPGLVLALACPESDWILIEAQTRRADFLDSAVQQLGLGSRVSVLHERAEVVGRSAGHRSIYDLVVARSFATPAVTAECGAPLLRQGGRLIVSEPPVDGQAVERWPIDGLQQLSLTLEEYLPGPPALAVFSSAAICPEKFPRRVGIPAKRPLW